MKALYYGDTNIGNIRPKNEDNFVLKEVWGSTHLLAVVVDGVGGNGGDVAADLASRCISEHFYECEQTPVEERVDKLINSALDAGGKDNITVIVIDLMK